MNPPKYAPRVHYFETTAEVETAIMRSYFEEGQPEVLHGDVLIVVLEGVVGFVYEMWAVALTEELGNFQTPPFEGSGDREMFEASIGLAEKFGSEWGIPIAAE